MDGVDIGTVNSPCFSHRMNKSLALAQIKASILVGAELQLKGGDIETTCSVVATPLYDPAKIRTHA